MTRSVILNFLPIALMIGLIPVIKNDYALAIVYLAFIIVLFKIHSEKHEFFVLVAGAAFMFCSELLFISTGVETFNRISLVGKMPIWLPLLWGYGFVAIKRFSLLMK